MIVFLQLICLPFFPKPLTVYPPLQAVAIAAIGLAAISFGGNVLLWALSVPRKFSIRSAVIKACIGILFITIEYPQTHREFVIAITQSSYTNAECLIILDCQRYASLHGGNWPPHLGPDISSWVVSTDGAGHSRIDVERINPQALPLTVTYHRPASTKGNEVVMEGVNPVPHCGYAIISQDTGLKWKSSFGQNEK